MFQFFKRQPAVQRISPAQAHNLILSGEKSGDLMFPVYRPFGLFYTKERGKFVGIDNSTGQAWVEEFRSRRRCLNWLRGKELLQRYH